MSRACTGLIGIIAQLFFPLSVLFPAQAQEDTWATLRQGGVALLRHAAPSREHSPQTLLQSEECQGQHWLSDLGQVQAGSLGERFRREGISAATILTSPLCPARATAEAIGLGTPNVFRGLLVAPASGSLWSTRAGDVLRRLIVDWRGPDTLVLVTHLGNIAALTGVTVDPGEGLVVLADGSGVRLVGRLSAE